MPKARILCVDDDVVFGDIILRYLREADFDAQFVSHGEDALHYARSEQPQAILLDVIVPRKSEGKDGFQLLEMLRNDDRTRHIPIVMLTDLASKEDIDLCFSLGACDYLIKSQHTPAEIVAILRRHCPLF